MDKKIAGLLGAAAALTAANSAQAATQVAATELQPAASYSDLLEPVPNALALLKTEDTQGTATRANDQTRLAQHHHHHHHRWWRRFWHHHHTTTRPYTSSPLLSFRNVAARTSATGRARCYYCSFAFAFAARRRWR